MKRICSYSTHKFEAKYLEKYSKEFDLSIEYFSEKLSLETVHKSKGFDAILCWANDDLSAPVLSILKQNNISTISLRCAGFSNLNFQHATDIKFNVMRVPSYSPESIAEHACALYLSLNRKLLPAFKRVKDFNFSLEGLEGELVSGKTVGIVGFGKIGESFANIMNGFGCKIQFFDEMILSNDVRRTTFENLLKTSDIISLHCPLNEKTHHMFGDKEFKMMKKSAVLINTGRGALIETRPLIEAIKSEQISGVALDVYEHEENIFFNDFSSKGIQDEELMILMSFPNVIITSHQAFFTKQALDNIARISLKNLSLFFKNENINSENILI